MIDIDLLEDGKFVSKEPRDWTEHSPHLTSQQAQTIYHGVGETIKGDCMRPSRVIRCIRLLPNPAVPQSSAAIQNTCSKTIELDSISTKDPRCGLVLIADEERVVQPVQNVRSPLLKFSINLTQREEGYKFLLEVCQED